MARDGDAGKLDGLRGPPVRGVVERDGAVVVQLAGELDLYNADEVRSALRDDAVEGAPRVVVDLSGVEFIDSTALGALVEARARLGDSRLVLAAPGLEARRALEVSGLDRHFVVRASVDEALSG